ncbi:MAG: hypothetical protein ACRDRZ_03475 [Pseudonocardiaceae bacterium]
MTAPRPSMTTVDTAGVAFIAEVAQLGDAVTPPASEWLYRRCLAALTSSEETTAWA